MKKIMLCNVGGTLPPLQQSVKSFAPDMLYLIASQDTIELAAELKKEAREHSPECRVEIAAIENPESLQDCYEVTRKVALKAANVPESQVMVDYTGGTKSMSAAVVLATADFRFEYAYTGGERRDRDNIGRVLDGCEKLYEMPVPLAYLQSSELEHVRHLYSGWNLRAAQQYCKELASILGRNLAGEFYKGLEKIMEGFYWWDNFRHETAARAFSKTDVSVLKTHDLVRQDNRLKQFLEGVQKSVDSLDPLAEQAKAKPIKPSMELARDLLANADRRTDEGRLDDAILRLYRIVEMTVQATLLEKYDIETESVPVSKLTGKELQALTKSESVNKASLTLSQEMAVRLLELKGNPLWKRMAPQEETRKKIQYVRNHCYLEHQLKRSADPDKYNRFREYVVEVMFGGEDVENFPAWEPAVQTRGSTEK